MIHFPVAFALLLHVLLWGAGAAMLAMPPRWRRFWPVLVVPAGFALQSAAVWAGALAGWRGTNAYALWAEALPVGLLVFALARNGVRRTTAEASRFGLVWALVAGCLALLVLPMAVASKSLTTISLGSCDAADYAAGARVLMEFARTDRDGLLGLAEVVRVHSVDNFFDYWIRLNHFTPSALIALNGTALGAAPHEITGLFTAVLLAGLLPIVFWVARTIVGHSGGVSLIIAGLFGVSPVTWYAFAHVAAGQLLAAQAVALLTWCGVALWRMRLTWRRGLGFAAPLAIGFWLILGSYNFFLLVCLVPAVAYVIGLAWWRGEGPKLVRWGAVVALPLLVCASLFWERVAGLVERFSLLRTYDFGWRVPALSAEGWLGMVSGPDLSAWDIFGLRWLLSAGVVGLLAWVFLRDLKRRRRVVWTVCAVTVPVLVPYLALQARGAMLGTNASYDAYKIFAVFQPVLLPALCWWASLRFSRRLHEWLLVVAAGGIVVLFNLLACGLFIRSLCAPPLRVDGQLVQLRRVEAMPDVKAVNMMFAERDMWSRLWASVYLLRKAQYFQTDTYEARWSTPLRGEWDLEADVAALQLPGDGRRQISPRYALTRTLDPGFLRVSTKEGWYPTEDGGASGGRWQWTKGDACLQVENPHSYPLRLSCTMDGWSPGPVEVALVGSEGVAPNYVPLGPRRDEVALPSVTVPPGTSQLWLKLSRPPVPVAGDSRALGVCVFRVFIRAEIAGGR
jgi:hypothetical protein